MSVIQRFGSVVQIKAECIDKYKDLHANTWPSVLKQNSDCHIKNYSIFLRKLPDGNHYLFSYLEYSGDDFLHDMALMAKNPEVLAWWDLCKPMHIPFEDRQPDEWWASMEQVFYQQ